MSENPIKPGTRCESYSVTSTKDIKRTLEQHFDWRGFSVTKKSNSRYVTIRWTNGPTHEQVSKLTGRWNDSKNDDSSTDLWIGSQYTNVCRDTCPDAARTLLSTFDLRKRMPALWELTQEAGRLACAQNDAGGWGAGEDWLELVNIVRPWPFDELLDGFKALGYEIEVTPKHETWGGLPAADYEGSLVKMICRYTFKPSAGVGPSQARNSEAVSGSIGDRLISGQRP